MKIVVYPVEYENPEHGADLLALMDHYAQDPMGGGQALPDSVRQTLVSNLAQLPHVISFLAYAENKAVGLVNAFELFSTFANEPLINIHDIVVHSDYRGQGIAQHLLAVVEEVAKARGCCKLTLEVLSGNTSAQTTYKRFGFESYALDPDKGEAWFWQKTLN
ncbi:MAG: GNAT family N-acetyltransferase [Pseudomonadota bacterium]